jgi:PAS domain S-box-containing protein
MKSGFFSHQSLLVQMITAFVGVVILASVTIGVPAIWLLGNQLERQAWAQVEQGQRVTGALYASHYREVLNLATLIAQRPTLQNFIVQQDSRALTEYLVTLQSGAGLDGIIICDPLDTLIATTYPDIPGSVCAAWETGSYQRALTRPGACLTAHQPIENESGYLGEAIVCSSLDDRFAAQLRQQTGLEHIIWIDEHPVSTSFQGSAALLEMIQSPSLEGAGQNFQRSFEIQEVPYYAAYLPLDENQVKAEVALDVTAIAESRTRLVGILIASILGVAMVGSTLGVLLAQRISRPLVRLSEAAESFSLGDLQSPVNIETQVPEITQVAMALENSRIDLLATMTSLQDERDWSGHLLASIVEGIVTLDGDSCISFFSHGAERVTGWNSEEVIGCPIDEVFRLENSDKAFSSILPSVPGGRIKAEVLLADHQPASLAITSARFTRSTEKKPGTVLVFRDISEEEAVHRLLGQFLANVAHEFLTPLSALEASIELLLDQAPDLDPAELHELHTSLHLGILGLHTLVDNLLESANIEARRFRVSARPCDLGNIIAGAVQTISPLLSKYEQHLTLELPMNIPFVQADPHRTGQVVINLLSNASRYGPQEEEIKIRVAAGTQFARVEVIDRGPGIPPEQRANLFKRFEFPHSKDAVSQAGAGLGLSVVKAIVEAQGGEVGVDDREGTGSVFWFTLPVVGDQDENPGG